MAWAGSVKLPALLISRLWFNSRMSSCQVDGPGAIPGSRTNSSQAARQHAAESPKLSLLRAARRQPAIFHLGSWQTSNALALQASLCGSVTHRLHQFQLRETRPMLTEKPRRLLQLGGTPTPATNCFREVRRLPDCKSGVREQSRKRRTGALPPLPTIWP